MGSRSIPLNFEGDLDQELNPGLCKRSLSLEDSGDRTPLNVLPYNLTNVEKISAINYGKPCGPLLVLRWCKIMNSDI